MEEEGIDLELLDFCVLLELGLYYNASIGLRELFFQQSNTIY